MSWCYRHLIKILTCTFHVLATHTYLLANSKNSLAYKYAYSIEILAYQYMFAIFLDTSCVCVIQEPKR